MSDSNITKLALADSLKDLMVVKRFGKISVGDIVTNCGLTRQAFYYHFKDKFDLMNWIYYTETARIMNEFSADNDIRHWTEGLIELCIYIRDNKTFYINALNTTGQNSFQEYLHDYIEDMLKSSIERIVGSEFTQEKWGFLC
jgi:probable dihydroxyacetone kinase regulator